MLYVDLNELFKKNDIPVHVRDMGFRFAIYFKWKILRILLEKSSKQIWLLHKPEIYTRSIK